MRLTLRTLLAYLDEILDPQDAEQLRRKIENSDFATALVHQIRSSVRRLRLDAPALDAQGIGGDLNSVAEYLDNTLAPDQVPAMEKVCLDSEIQLGEVASCHQILTLVLGQAAEVNESMRQRAYSIAPTTEPSESPSAGSHQIATPLGTIPAPPPATAASPTQQEPPVHMVSPSTPGGTVPGAAPREVSAPVSAPAAGSASEPGRRLGQEFTVAAAVPSTKEAWRADAKQQALEDEALTPPPDYLRPARSSALRTALVASVVVLLIAAAFLLALGPIGRDHPMAQWLGIQTRSMAETTPAPVDDPAAFENNVAPPTDVEMIEIEKFDSTQGPMRRTGDPQSTAERQGADIRDALPLAGDLPLDTPEDPFAAAVAETFPDAGQQDALATEENETTIGFAAPANAEGTSSPAIADSDSAPAATASPDEDVPFGESDNRDLAEEVSTVGEDPSVDAAEVVETQPGTAAGDDAWPDEVSWEDDDPTPVSSVASSEPVPDGTDTLFAPDNEAQDTLVDPDVELVPESFDPPAPGTADLAEASPDFSRGRAEVGFINAPPAPRPTPTNLEKVSLKQADQLLLVLDEQTDEWRRVNPTTSLSSGDLLLGMPAFRSDLEIGSKLTCTTVGTSRLQLGPDADLTLVAGQILIEAHEADTAQGIIINDQRYQILLPNAGDTVALDVARLHVPGADPENERPHTVIKIYAIQGHATVGHQDQLVEVSEGQHLWRVDDHPLGLDTEGGRPEWLASTSLSQLDVNAVRYWKRDLADAETIRLWLQERTHNRRYNERALAARCLAEMDQFDAIVAALNDPEQHPFWNQHYETLQRALTRGPQVAAKLQLELEKVHGERAEPLFEMIRGYNGQQLAGGAARFLVQCLEHPSLDFRVLAFQNLKRITGFTQLYHPEKPIGSRRRPVSQWKKKLVDGRIVYAKTPEIVALLESVTAATGETSN